MTNTVLFIYYHGKVATACISNLIAEDIYCLSGYFMQFNYNLKNFERSQMVWTNSFWAYAHLKKIHLV